MGMSQKELREWEEAGYLVNDPTNFDKISEKDCLEHAVDGIAKDIPGWKFNKTQYKLTNANGKMNLKKQKDMLDQADKKAAVSRLSLLVFENEEFKKDKKQFNEQLGKIFSVLALNQDEDFIKNFSLSLNGFSQTNGSHMHSLDLKALASGKQNYDPQFAFKNLKKMEDVFSQFERLTLDVRTKLDLKNEETLQKLVKILELLPLKTNGICAIDNFQKA